MLESGVYGRSHTGHQIQCQSPYCQETGCHLEGSSCGNFLRNSEFRTRQCPGLVDPRCFA